MGKAKMLIERLISLRAKGDAFLEKSTRFKLLIKGIDAGKITEETPDDPLLLEKIYEVASNLDINLH